MIAPTTSWRRVLLVSGAAALLVGIGGVVARASGDAEAGLARDLNSLHTGLIGQLGDALYTGFEPPVAVATILVLTGLVWLISRDLRVAATFAVTIAVTWLPVAGIKLLVDRSRPPADLMPYPYHPIQVDASYPSGHETFIAATLMALILMTRPSRRPLVVAVSATIALAAALLLAIDSVHYPSDVAASIVWAVGIAPLVRAVGVWVVGRLRGRGRSAPPTT